MIKTLADLDKWIENHPKKITTGPYKGEVSLVSRYSALKILFGENKADSIMHNLMVKSWDLDKMVLMWKYKTCCICHKLFTAHPRAKYFETRQMCLPCRKESRKRYS